METFFSNANKSLLWNAIVHTFQISDNSNQSAVNKIHDLFEMNLQNYEKTFNYRLSVNMHNKHFINLVGKTIKETIPDIDSFLSLKSVVVHDEIDEEIDMFISNNQNKQNKSLPEYEKYDMPMVNNIEIVDPINKNVQTKNKKTWAENNENQNEMNKLINKIEKKINRKNQTNQTNNPILQNKNKKININDNLLSIDELEEIVEYLVDERMKNKLSNDKSKEEINKKEIIDNGKAFMKIMNENYKKIDEKILKYEDKIEKMQEEINGLEKLNKLLLKMVCKKTNKIRLGFRHS